ncbi:MAG: hypothetical protein QS98_C0009G0034, partial [archaeon GW2011_AR3]
MKLANSKVEIAAILVITALAIMLGYAPYSLDVKALGLFSTNDSAISKANVTNEYPNVRNVRLYSNLSFDDIELYPAQLTKVYCNATIDDGNGYIDINSSNATIFHTSNVSTDPDAPTAHYTNGSCRLWQGSG